MARVPLRRSAPTAVLALLIAAAATVRAAEGLGADARARLRAELDAHRSDHHLSEGAFPVERILDEVERRLRAGASREKPGKLVEQAVAEVCLAWAPRGGKPSPRFKYRYPFDTTIPRMMVQGPNGSWSHRGTNAYDFPLSIGTELLAARRGRVVVVVDDFYRGGLGPEEAYAANSVEILHPDGTWAKYAHLRAGIPVKEGQRVRAGQLIGYSGNTGQSTAPHLHFEVAFRDENGEVQTTPVRFQNGTAEGRVLEEFAVIMGRPPSAAPMRVRSNGVLVQEDVPRPARVGDRERLSVELVLPTGAIDITRDPRTDYLAATPWNVSVSGMGHVHLARDPNWKSPALDRLETAVVTVRFHDPETDLISFFDASWDVSDPDSGSGDP